MRPKAINVKPKENYVLEIEFDNGEVKLFDVKPYLNHKAFEDLKDIDKFNKVKVDGLSIAWENGADICPDELYNLSK
ncbi:MAG: DUF2442 domain-containing protein [Clostridia bacterium]|nr:DUF2442 domain-containing protein [Clostridia bacterium]